MKVFPCKAITHFHFIYTLLHTSIHDLHRTSCIEITIVNEYNECMHEAKLHTKGLEIMFSDSELDEVSSSPCSLSLEGIDKRLLLLSACYVS